MKPNYILCLQPFREIHRKARSLRSLTLLVGQGGFRREVETELFAIDERALRRAEPNEYELSGLVQKLMNAALCL